MLTQQSRESEEKKYNIVLDTNIFISGIFWKGDSYSILGLLNYSIITVTISSEIIAEVYRILSNFKIKMSQEDVDDWIRFIEEKCVIVEPKEKFFIVEDPTDNKFIDCAVAGNASYIITNDKHLLKIKKFRNISIITPKEFIIIIKQESF
jgi:uncharacterized protein